MDWDSIKETVAIQALKKVPSSGLIGLGTGTTSRCFIKALSTIYPASCPHIRCISTSIETEEYAKSLGLPVLSSYDWNEPVEITFDGADAIDIEGTAIKGAGGALLREKVVAFSSKRLVLMIDERKWKKPWHEVLFPLEVLRFGVHNSLQALHSIGLQATLRMKNEQIFVTSDKNCIIDLPIPQQTDLIHLDSALHQIPGIIETGLFYHFASEIIIGYGNGKIEELQVHNVSRFRPSVV